MTKRLSLILLVLTSLVFSASSQNKAFQFGFKVAPNIGWMKPDAQDYSRNGIDAGFSWGFQAEFFLMENYAFNTGFDVVYLNGSLDYPYKSGSKVGVMSRSIKSKYIELPLILKMKTNDFGKFRFYGQVGFGLGFLLDAEAEDRFFSQGVLDEKKTLEIRKQLRFTRESLILGAGAEYSLGGSTFLFAGIKFDNGFIDILKDQNTVNSSIENKAISNYLEIQIGLMF